MIAETLPAVWCRRMGRFPSENSYLLLRGLTCRPVSRSYRVVCVTSEPWRLASVWCLWTLLPLCGEEYLADSRCGCSVRVLLVSALLVFWVGSFFIVGGLSRALQHI